ncbi:MAG: glycosyltransferase family 2 protein [Peptostreptococcaceae bacterium]
MSSKNCMVSIIVPVYNSEKYIENTIISVLNQSIPKEKIELLLIDDGSSDGSIEIIHKYQSKYNFIYAFYNDINMGVSNTRNKGVNLANGKYIAFLDADDLWEKNKLEIQMNFMESNNYLVTYTNYNIIDKEGINLYRSINNFDFNVTYESIIRENIICLSSTMIRSTLLEVHKMNSQYKHEDLIFWIDILKSGVMIKGIDDILTSYRIVKGSRSNNKIYSSINRWIIYRDYLKMNYIESIYYFMIYFINGIKKYNFLLNKR